MAADKKITMVIKVELDCERCNKRIRRVLQKIQDKMNIETTSFDETRNLVTISGPFDADKVRRKLCCEASRIIKGIDVIIDEEDDDDEEEDEEERKPAVVPVVVDNINLRPLAQKLLERPKKARPRPQPAPCKCSCGCTCSKKKTTRPPAQDEAEALLSVWPAPASSVSGHGYAAPSPYYGVPVYSVKAWY